MYGDTADIRRDAAYLSSLSEQFGTRSVALGSSVSGAEWSSQAGSKFQQKASDMQQILQNDARLVAAAAAALSDHAAAVDEVKAQISDAERRVGSFLEDAYHTAQNTVQTLENVASDAVNGFMQFISSTVDSITGETKSLVRVWQLDGQQIDSSKYSRACAVARAVPERPASGSKDWLDLASRYSGCV